MVEGGDFGNRLPLWLFKAPEVGSGLLKHPGKLSPESKLTLPSLSLLPTGQLPPGSGSPRDTFSLGLSPGRHLPAHFRELLPASTQQGLGQLQVSDSKVLPGEEKGGKAAREFPKRERQPMTQGAAAGSSPHHPHPSACWHVHKPVTVHEQCVLWWSPAGASKALQS